ncbi:MAG: hypothetical protein LQ343_007119 [Gyalolechia ehrenbergii]|nr:MAG: hypothetical protein LQ343_007119 [Gyalolechia ehrenbergii]
MRSSMITASAALVAGAAATHYNGTEPIQYTTEIVTAYETYCPAATQITHGGVTYTVTEATTLTITNCPCTVTKPMSSAPVVYCSTYAPTSPAAPVVPTSSAVVSPAPVGPVTSVPTVGQVSQISEGQVQAPVTTTPAVPVSPVSPVVPIGTGSPVVSPPVVTGTGTPVPPVVSPPIYGNTTVPAGPTVPSVPSGSAPGVPSGTGAPGSSPVAPFQGAAPKMAASGASLAGLLGLVAFFL